MNEVLLPLIIGMPLVTLTIDLMWYWEQRGLRRVIEKTQTMCSGHAQSPSGFFRTRCPRRAAVLINGEQRCLDPVCREQSRDQG